MMKAKTAVFFSAFSLTAMGSLAYAEPVELTDEQMDVVTAGQDQDLIDVDIRDVTVAIPLSVNAAANVCVIAESCNADSTQTRPGRIDVNQ